MSIGTYRQHLGSKRHHIKREDLKTPGKVISKSSSLSSFEVIGAEKSIQCLFCQEQSSHSHLQEKHNFPPFEQECVNIEGLISLVKEKIENFTCMYCNHKFASEESVRQHINDVSHCKLDLNNFEEYEKFYLWKIEEESEAEDIDNEENKNKEHLTLKELEQRIQDRIHLTSTGAIINGKEVGYRHLKNYYKQFLNREVKNLREKYQPAIESEKSEWKTCSTYSEKGKKICFITSCR